METASIGFSREGRREIRWCWETQGKEGFCLFLDVAKLERIYRPRDRKPWRRVGRLEAKG